ncbi:hypothetical protein Hdeb2414_s0024g00650151 [Helianthus debilis subsp. tardiflorus]
MIESYLFNHLNVCCNGSLFTNSNWFAFEEERVVHEQSNSAVVSQSPDTDATIDNKDVDSGDEVASNEHDKDLVDSATSESFESKPGPNDTAIRKSTDESTPNESDKPLEWIKWRESESVQQEQQIETAVKIAELTDSIPNGNLEVTSTADIAGDGPNKAEVSPPLLLMCLFWKIMNLELEVELKKMADHKSWRLS